MGQNEQSRQLDQIKQMQQMFKANMKTQPYPMYPNYGKITRYEEIPISLPEQRQLSHPGVEKLMVPLPIIENPNYTGSGKLTGKVALITGGDNGIGAAVAIAFAKEGADVAISYLIIGTTSVVTYVGEQQMIDYTATKGAIVGWTRALAKNVVKQGIRVNAVAPGRIWTPLIAASFSSDQVAVYGAFNPMKRVAHPFELAPTFVYLASDDSRFVTGQVLHVDGGESTNS